MRIRLGIILTMQQADEAWMDGELIDAGLNGNVVQVNYKLVCEVKKKGKRK